MIKKLTKPGWLDKIKVLVWDLDGTLYQEVPQMKKEIHNNVLKAIAKNQSVSLLKAEELFKEAYLQLHSSTRTLLHFGVNRDYVLSGDWYNQAQLKYLQKDPRLVKVFEKLAHLKHIINTNSERSVALKKLKILDLDLSIFDKIFTSTEMRGKVKPDPYSFQLVLQFTKLESSYHLFIGDSLGKEIIPAKELGMKTCLLWDQSEVADLSLPTVYDMVELFQ